MGYWLETCAVSNLPIDIRDEVIVLITIKNPYLKSAKEGFEPNSFWKIVSLPLRGTYSGYGGIDFDSQDDDLLELALEEIKASMVEEDLERSRLEAKVCAKSLNKTNLCSWIHEGALQCEMHSLATSPQEVSSVLIRKDIWDFVLSKTYGYGFTMEVNLDFFKKDVDKFLKQSLILKDRLYSTNISNVIFELESSKFQVFTPNNHILNSFSSLVIGPNFYTLQLQTVFNAYLKKGKGELENSLVQKAFYKAAEISLVEGFLRQTRNHWHNNTSKFNDPDWAYPIEAYLAFTNIALQGFKKELEDKDYWSGAQKVQLPIDLSETETLLKEIRRLQDEYEDY